MRLIGLFDTEQKALSFHSFLLQKGIPNSYEPDNPFAEKPFYRVWVQREEDSKEASEWYLQFQRNPDVSLFQIKEKPKKEELIEPSVIQVQTSRKGKGITPLLIFICCFLFLWNSFQESQVMKHKGVLALQVSLTPLMQKLLFDYPKAFEKLNQFIQEHPMKTFQDVEELPLETQLELKKIEAISSWKGILEIFPIIQKEGLQAISQIPIFEKIRQGQIWRLVTPIFLHRDFLHILFNMAWLFLFGKQLDLRIGKKKMLVLIFLLAIASNVAQYIMSGPYFIGISGIVVGMGGFIWMRQKKAPWEGYSIQKSTLLLLFFFVVAMVVLDGVIWGIKLFYHLAPALQIANTAHVVGGLTGAFLGCLSWFKKGLS
ncbi:MAG: rhomboid family intramembrane serine protease [Chlamydiales bacterium]|jgi:GlpG protein|nr:rhomboid family intramembrane serine protease [Chlamydiales bacterium]